MRTALSYSCWTLQWGNTCPVCDFKMNWKSGFYLIQKNRYKILTKRSIFKKKPCTEPWSHTYLRQVKSRHRLAARLGVRARWGLEAAVHVLCARHVCQSTLIIFVFYVCGAGCWIQSLCLLRVCSVNWLNSLPPLCHIFLAMRRDIIYEDTF